jgi:hypothetical protein
MALKNLACVSLPLTPPLNRFPLQSVLDINPIPQLGFSTSDPNPPLENCVQQSERWVHSQDSPYFAVTKHPHHSVIANRELLCSAPPQIFWVWCVGQQAWWQGSSGTCPSTQDYGNSLWVSCTSS